MKILMSGSTGLLGTAISGLLREQGHHVASLVRPSTRTAQTAGQSVVAWDPVSGALDSAAEDSGAVIHLAGASIGSGRWSESRKHVLVESRVAATRNLVSALGKLRRPPQVFVAASAIGYYGDRGDEVLTEESSAGNDFLARLCRDWEAESSRASEFRARVVILRFGIVLAKQGGALRQMMLPFRFGFGGPVGSGRQWMSWIALNDLVGIVAHAISDDQMGGIFNAVAPQPVRNREFAVELGRAMHRPALLPAPAFALRIALGEMADGLLLASQRVMPRKLETLPYSFLYPELESALPAVLQGGR